MKRREFVGAVTAASTLAAAGAARAAAAPAVQTRDRRAELRSDWDLIVIGAGTAGMPAAIFAAEAGARVLVIERSPVVGGTLDRSTGQISASRTVFQQAKGIVDSPDEHYADNMRINDWTADAALTRLFVDEAPDTVNWLAANGFQVIEGDPVKSKGHDPFTIARYQNGSEGGKSILAVMKPLFDAAVKAGKISLKLETGAVDLVQDSAGAVVGVVSEGASGQREESFGRKVLIASGGCAANARMFEDLHGVPLTAEIAYPWSQGQGLTLALAAGGVLRGGDKYVPLYGTLLESDNFPSAPGAAFNQDPLRREPWEIHVNARGDRFVREDHPSHEHREHALAKQPGHRLWVVYDSAIARQAPPFLGRMKPEQIREAFTSNHPMFATATDLTVMAVKTGMDPRRLHRSVQQFNSAIETRSIDPFGRGHRPLALREAPFFAVRMTGWTVISFAGITVDGSLRVLREDGAVIPNLYAAGEALGAGATSGSAYTNGTMVTPALAFGRWLGRRAMQSQAHT
ncbi:MAG: FAD-dependent oxidoreductase [Steroidobacteraceae bacterium]